MELEKKRTLALGILLGSVILIAVVYALWGNLINRGTIKIIGDAPFAVEVFDVGEYPCQKSPCEIDQKSGEKDLIIRKEGYSAVIAAADVPLWGVAEIEVKFTITPFIQKLENPYTPTSLETKYTLVFDETNKMQKLIRVDDQNKVAIVYFPKAIKVPSIFGSKNNALVVDREVTPMQSYKVDISSKKRTLIIGDVIALIKEGKWSVDGKYLIFSVTNSPNLWILNNKNEFKELLLTIDISRVSFADNDSFVFVTDQKLGEEGGFNKHGEKYTKFLEGTSDGIISFGRYYPEEDKYTKILSTKDITSLPNNLMPTANGKEVYFQVGADSYKLTLK